MDPVGLGIDDVAYDYPPDAERREWTPATSPAAVGEHEDDDDDELALGADDDELSGDGHDDGDDYGDATGEGEGEAGDETYADSVTSSDACDPDIDPALFAARLDGLAGVYEVGEAEARAVRWGPAIGRERNAPDLPIPEFRALLMHHLDATDWMYDTPDAAGEQHLVRVFGPTWSKRGVGAMMGDEAGAAGGATPGLR